MTVQDTPSPSAGMLCSVDPATHEIVGEVAATPASAIRAMVDDVQLTQRDWARLSPRARAERIVPAGKAFLARLPELARLITREMGKPLAQAEGEVRYFAEELPAKLDEMVEALAPETIEDGQTRSVIFHEGYGVCAVIAPWNFPFAEPLEMLVPALMAGNGVILKPSEETPLIADALVGIMNETLPAGILRTIHGAEEQGKTLVADPGVSLVVFTGSQAAGKHILAAGSASLKRVILELGGKDPLIVLDDADLDAAASFAIQNSFRNAGQVCVSTERIYVSAAVAEPFERRIAALARDLKVGPGTDPGSDVGPMVNQDQKQRVLRFIDAAVAAGATPLVDGTVPYRDNGNFLGPTILTEVSGDMDIMRNEVFGPVTCVMRYGEIDAAIEMANDTGYGLGAVVFGRDEARAFDVARRIEAGMIGVNRRCGGAKGTPWIGAKQSGFSWHSGKEGHRHFAQARVVSVAI